jgi:hypothetical protein
MAYLASIEGYRTNQYAISAAERKMVDAAWRPYVRRWQEMLDL